MAKANATVEQWLTPKQASDTLGISIFKLKAWRNKKIGPRFIKLGKSDQSRVVYSSSDLAAWQAKQARVETLDSKVA